MPAGADPELTLRLAQETARIYTEASATMITRVADRLAKGIDGPHWTQEKLADMVKLRTEAAAILDKAGKAVNGSVADALETAHTVGIDDATKELKKLELASGSFFHSNRGQLEALVRDTIQGLQGTHGFILRDTLDKYRSIVASTAPGVLTGTETRRTATARALQQFAKEGIKGFQDKAGRQWEIESYAEMAMRTASGRAQVDGSLAKYAASGRDLVVVSDSPEECPICRPWERKVLSISGATTGTLDRGVVVTGTVADARGKGFQHSNCTHKLNLYVPGLTIVDDADANPAGNALRNQQRNLERNVRQLRRQVVAQKSLVDGLKSSVAGVDPTNADTLRKLQQREREATERLNGFIEEHDRKRLDYRTKVPGFRPSSGKPPPAPKAPAPAPKPAPKPAPAKIQLGPLGAPKNLPPLKPPAAIPPKPPVPKPPPAPAKPSPVPKPAKPPAAGVKAGLPGTSTSVLGKSPVDAKLLAKLKPVQSYSTSASKARETAIRKLPGGGDLMDVVQDFQGGGTAATRNKVEAYLAGKKLPAAQRKQVEALLDAIDKSPREFIPDRLYRGMVIDGEPGDIAAGMPEGNVLEFNVSGFSSSRAVSSGFARPKRPGQTSVMIVWDAALQTPGYNARKALPIQNTSRIRTYFSEKEFLAGGRFYINKVVRSGKSVTVHVSQIRGIE